MLFSLGHGQRIFTESSDRTRADLRGSTRAATATQAAPESTSEYAPMGAVIEEAPATAALRAGPTAAAASGAGASPPPASLFGYYFEAAAGLSEDDVEDALHDLAEKIVTDAGDPAEDSDIPPVFTYFGQFIDHDITANTDRDRGLSTIRDGADLTPLKRSDVKANIFNLRKGSLGLDSLYGDGPSNGPFSDKLQELMRWGDSGPYAGKMRLDTAIAVNGKDRGAELPNDPAVDLLRLGRLLCEGTVTVEEIRELPDPNPDEPDLKSVFLDVNGNPIRSRAIIGDARNDENLIVGQFQIAFLRLHNTIVDWLSDRGVPKRQRFARAQELTRWHYQWLVVNVFLPTVCDPAIVKMAIDDGAPLYTKFLEDGSYPKDTESLPLPLEFSVAAYRFGHSMIRPEYDYNRIFGRPKEAGKATKLMFEDAFLFAGAGGLTEPGTKIAYDRMPHHRIIDWSRYVMPVSQSPDPADGSPRRAARKIDALLSVPLNKLINEGVKDKPDVLKRLAERNLRRGNRLNIPTGQSCVKALNKSGLYPGKVTVLSKDELTDGPTGDVIRQHFLEATPLWFYVLKEAKVRASGERLGPLGSVLVADTLVGLVANDPSSYWNQKGKSWHPKHGAQPGGKILEDLVAVFRATGQIPARVAGA